MKKYVITGATGNVGKAVALELLTSGNEVFVVGRSADKLSGLTSKGAKALLGDVYDGSFVEKAFSGADAVFCMIPPSFHSKDYLSDQIAVARNYLNAVKVNNVRHVVLLSSIGAHLRKGAGIVDGLGQMEELFSTLEGVNVLNLRPSYFMENILGQIPTIKHMGIAGSPINAELKFPVVATRDIAAVAAKRLLEAKFTGNSVEYVLGPRDINYNEITAVIGKAIGMPELKYVQFANAEAIKAMAGSGFCSENVAELMVGLSEGINNGTVFNAHERTEANTTPTSVEEFASLFAALYNS